MTTTSILSGISNITMLLLYVCFINSFWSQPVQAMSLSPKDTASFRLFFEKVYLHTDRDYYAAGDDLWFKAYLVNGQSNYLMNTSHNLYVELISPAYMMISREVVRMDEGLGHGDFHLSDSLASGTYRLRAYTNWMRNFGDNFIFEKTLHITGKEGTASPSPNTEVRRDEIHFFPEGGSLIEGVAGVAAFKATDATGKGMEVTGIITSSGGDTICRFTGIHQGMGCFSLMPLPGETYTATGILARRTPFAIALTPALPQGFAMQTVVRDTSDVLINITTNAATFVQYQGTVFMLKALGHGKTIFSLEVPIKQLQTTLRIPWSYFPGGITSLTLYDPQMRPHCERLVYTPPHKRASIKVFTDKQHYHPRDSVQVTINVTGHNGQPVKAWLSLAAVDAGAVPEGISDIVSYLELESEVKGGIENPKIYFDTTNANRFKQLDLLLLTQGWRDFVWKRMKDTSIVIKYLPEAGFTISGRVRQRLLDKPVVNTNVTMQLPGAGKKSLQGTRTDSSGRFYFDPIAFYGQKKLTLTSKTIKNKASGWIWMDSLYRPMPVARYPLFRADTLVFLFGQEVIRRKQIRRKYSLTDTIPLEEVVIKEKAKQIIYIDGLPLMQIGPDRKFKVTPDDTSYANFELYLYNKAPDLIPKNLLEPPIYRIMYAKELDSINNLNYLLRYRDSIPARDLSMNKIEKIIIKRMGGGRKNLTEEAEDDFTSIDKGVTDWKNDFFFVCVYPKPGATLQRPEFYRLVEYVKGYYEAREFYAPRHKVPQASFNPSDFRTTLYWVPGINIHEKNQAKLTFSNADITTKVRIVVQGVTEDGVPILGETRYEVK